MTEIKKAQKPVGLQGLLVSVCNRSRPLDPEAPNNNDDADTTAGSGYGDRIGRSWMHST
jgi:hypothetical protein